MTHLSVKDKNKDMTAKIKKAKKASILTKAEETLSKVNPTAVIRKNLNIMFAIVSSMYTFYCYKHKKVKG